MAVLVAAVLVARSVVGVAAVASAKATTYSACVAKSSGALYGVTAKGKPRCKGHDKVISWGSSGPAGPSGPTGVAGSPGAAGPPATTLGQFVTSAAGTGSLSLAAAGTTYSNLPGLAVGETVTAGERVLISTDGSIQTASGGTVGQFTMVDITVAVDGNNVSGGLSRRVTCAVASASITGACEWSLTSGLTVTPGTHTFTVRARGAGASSVGAVLGGNSSSSYSDELTVTVVKT